MEHEGAVLTGAGGGGLTHLHLVAATLGSSQLSPAPLPAWIGSAQRGRSREQQVLDQRSKDRPPTVRESSREQHGLGSCGQGETRRSRKSREEQNLRTGGGLEEGGDVQSREEQSSCVWEVGKGRGRSCSCVGSGEGKGRGALMG
jgi:hypothetical protein